MLAVLLLVVVVVVVVGVVLVLVLEVVTVIVRPGVLDAGVVARVVSILTRLLILLMTTLAFCGIDWFMIKRKCLRYSPTQLWDSTRWITSQ